MVKQVDKVLEVTRPKVGPEMVPNSPRVSPDTLEPNLFDIDPNIEPERPIHIDLDLDQLEDAEE